MKKNTLIYALLTFSAVFMAQSPGYCGYNRIIEDVIDIHVAQRELIAIKNGETLSKLTLKLNENILWRGSRGYVGAVLTSERLLAVTKTSNGWMELPLRLGERKNEEAPEVRLSGRLILVTTGKRIIALDSRSNQWTTADIGLHDHIEKAVIDTHVGVVVTTGRAYGIARDVPALIEEPLKENETVLSVDTSPYSVTIRTTRRLLIFKSTGANWREIDTD